MTGRPVSLSAVVEGSGVDLATLGDLLQVERAKSTLSVTPFLSKRRAACWVSSTVAFPTLVVAEA